ncbi:hypothetical protein ACTHAM_002178 [Cellulomonas soli]|uniref:hypothetical protein n=1 Tax=Cellulomonas soli TaxID=931535 RepID=UPI003F834E37
MQASSGRGLGAGRLLLVSTTVFALGVGAHVLGGGATPGARTLGALGALVLACTAWTTRAPLRARSLLPLAVLAQAGLHTALAWLAPSGTTATSPGSGGRHLHADAALASLAAADPAGAGVGTHAHAFSLTMVAAHLAATLLTVALLIGTDRAVATVAHLWTVLLPALLTPRARPIDRPVRHIGARHADWATAPALLARTQVRRGPPTVAPAG